jgi:hypothetical protein
MQNTIQNSTEEQVETITLYRVKNDTCGNPRYVVHFLSLLTEEESNSLDVFEKYNHALSKARKIGGKKFHNKQFGGGVVFQCYNTESLVNEIAVLTNRKLKGYIQRG